MALEWQRIFEGNLWDTASQWSAIDAQYVHGDYGLMQFELRAPVPQDVLSAVQGALEAAGVILTQAVEQVGGWLNIYFQRNPGPAIIIAVLAGLLALAIFVTGFVVGWKGVQVSPPVIPPEMASALYLGVLLVGAVLILGQRRR